MQRSTITDSKGAHRVTFTAKHNSIVALIMLRSNIVLLGRTQGTFHTKHNSKGALIAQKSDIVFPGRTKGIFHSKTQQYRGVNHADRSNIVLPRRI